MKPFIILTLFSLLFLVNSLRSRRNKNKSKLSIIARGEIEEVQINGNTISVTPTQNNGESILQTELILFPGDIISIQAKTGYGQKGGISGYLEYVDEYNKITKIITNKEKWICDQTYPGEESKQGSNTEVWIWGPKYESSTNCKIQIPCLDEKPQTTSKEPSQQNVLSPVNPVVPEIRKKMEPDPSPVNPNVPTAPSNGKEKTETLDDKTKISSDSNNLIEKNNKPSEPKKQPSLIPNPQNRHSPDKITPGRNLPTLNDRIKNEPNKVLMKQRMDKIWYCDNKYKIAFQEEKKNFITCLTKDQKRCVVFDSVEACREEVKNPTIRMTAKMCSTGKGPDQKACEKAAEYIKSLKHK